MTEPTPEQLERLKEIASKNAFPHEEKRYLAGLLTVWREAQGEKENWIQASKCEYADKLELVTKIHQLEASLNEAITELKHVDTILLRRPSLCLLPRQNQIEKAIEDIGKLEASLRLAVECLATVVHNDKEAQKQLMEMGYPMSLHASTDTMNSTLSTIRANHPQLMEGEK
jgi:hypothetical protein